MKARRYLFKGYQKGYRCLLNWKFSSITLVSAIRGTDVEADQTIEVGGCASAKRFNCTGAAYISILPPGARQVRTMVR